MDINDYVLAKVENYILLEAAVAELAEHLGHSVTDPLSMSLFCLETGLSLEERDKIMSRLSLLADRDYFESDKVRADLEKIVPKFPSFQMIRSKGCSKFFEKKLNKKCVLDDLKFSKTHFYLGSFFSRSSMYILPQSARELITGRKESPRGLSL